MKKFLTIMAFVAIALGISSCNQNKLSPYSNLPTHNFSKLSETSSVEKAKPVNLFTIEVSNESNEVLHIVFGTLKNSLATGLYTPATTAELGDGNFDSEKSFIQIGDSNKQLSTKSLVVNSVGKNLYSISGIINIDGKDKKITTAPLEIKLNIPETVVSSYTFTKYDIAPNTGLVTVKMYEESIEMTEEVIDLSIWGMEGTYINKTYSGSGKMLSLDLYSEDGTIVDGVYQGVENDKMGPGKFAFGYDSGMGIWGGCFTVFDNSNKTEIAVVAGTVTVATKGNKQTITAELELANDTKIKTTCSISLGGDTPEPPTPGGDVIIVPNMSTQINEGSVTIKMWENSVIGNEVDLGFYKYWDYSGDGKMVSIDFYSEDGTLADGIYEGVAKADLGPGKFATGYGPSPETYNMVWGACYTVFDSSLEAKKTEYAITAGTVEVKTIDGVQVIICDVELADGTKIVSATKEGVIGGDTGDTGDVIELPNVTEASFGNGLFTIKMYDDGVVCSEQEMWGYKFYGYGGTGKYLSLDLVVDGALTAGEYTPAENGAYEIGNFVIGYDSGGMGIWGCCYKEYVDNVETAYIVNGGVVTVTEKDGGFDIVANVTIITEEGDSEISCHCLYIPA